LAEKEKGLEGSRTCSKCCSERFRTGLDSSQGHCVPCPSIYRVDSLFSSPLPLVLLPGAPTSYVFFFSPVCRVCLGNPTFNHEAVLPSILRLCLVVCERNWPLFVRPPSHHVAPDFRHRSTFCLPSVASLLLRDQGSDIHQLACPVVLARPFRPIPPDTLRQVLGHGMTETSIHRKSSQRHIRDPRPGRLQPH
jgi:hypothetical protein